MDISDINAAAARRHGGTSMTTGQSRPARSGLSRQLLTYASAAGGIGLLLLARSLTASGSLVRPPVVSGSQPLAATAEPASQYCAIRSVSHEHLALHQTVPAGESAQTLAASALAANHDAVNFTNGQRALFEVCWVELFRVLNPDISPTAISGSALVWVPLFNEVVAMVRLAEPQSFPTTTLESGSDNPPYHNSPMDLRSYGPGGANHPDNG